MISFLSIRSATAKRRTAANAACLAYRKKTVEMWGYCWCQLGACHTNSQEVVVDVHHIVPVEAGGSDDDDNLILLCEACHALVHRLFRTVHIGGKKLYAGPRTSLDLTTLVRSAEQNAVPV